MVKMVYFDTDAFHRIGRVFSSQPLAGDLRERILLAPLTALEALSHLTLKDNRNILGDIQAMHNWVNPTHAGLLPWPDIAIANIGFKIELKEDSFLSSLQETINLCLATCDPEEFRYSADKLKNTMDQMKDSETRRFTGITEANRRETNPILGERFSEIWMHGLAQRAKTDPKRFRVQDLVSALSAYHEFEQDIFTVATTNPQYKPDPNNILDAEQLIYLGRPELNFLTCDGGYLKRVKKSPQLSQIHRASVDDLATANGVETILRRIMSP